MTYYRVSDIIDNPDDFKKCKSCGAINWYENEECVNCGGTKFRELNEEDLKNLEEYADEVSKDYDTAWEDVEIEF